MEENTKKRILLLNMTIENKVKELFFSTMSHLKGKYKEFLIVTDDYFSKKKDRITSDIHLFITYNNNRTFHLKAYTSHTIENIEKYQNNKVFLTGYQKEKIEWKGGKHSLRQDWYEQESKLIANEIVFQNKELFK